MDRSRIIIRTSIVGITVNAVLVLAKMAVGFLSNSIAVILDAVNNLGDALSSLITIIGTRLAGRAPDKKHPYGYGRIEYLTSAVIAVIVLLAGISSLRESADKILHPQTADYTVVTLTVIIMGIAAKLLCGGYVRSVGKKINAQTLVASGSDAFFDAILSVGTLLAAVVSMIWGLSLEGILGLLISVVILKAGVEMLLETLNSIIGTRTDKELTDALKERINSYEQVRGAYDLALHNKYFRQSGDGDKKSTGADCGRVHRGASVSWVLWSIGREDGDFRSGGGFSGECSRCAEANSGEAYKTLPGLEVFSGVGLRLQRLM